MFTDEQMARAIDLQARSYELLQWVSSAIEKGFISFKAAHHYSSISSAAEEWITRHYQNLPEAAKPKPEDIKEFSCLFATYLENSFELVSNPGKRLYSPEAHCFCPFCSWLVDVPHLKTRSLTPADKKRAQRMTADALRYLASEQHVCLSEKSETSIVADANLREPLALFTYGLDLLHRMKGTAVGPAALALWRTFAWLPSGSPKKKFKLSTDLILQAKQTLQERILREAS